MEVAIDRTRAHQAPHRFRERYGPWAVVTGASDGIGRELARCLAESGLHLVLVARRHEVLDALAAELSAAHAIETRVVDSDLGTTKGVKDVFRVCERLDVGLLVAAAGFGTSGRFVEADIDAELGMIDLNCRAVAALSHHFGARFAERRRGGIVLLSSLVAFQGVPRAANYSATKAYVQSLAEAIRIELRPFGVDVVSSAPGPTSSGFAKRADMKMGLATPSRVVAEGTLDALGRQGTVRPGWLSKLLEWALTLLPRWGRVRMMGIVMGGMTKHRA